MKRLLRVLLLAFLLFSAGCAPLERLRFPAAPTPTPPSAPSETPALGTPGEPQHMVAVTMWVDGQVTARPELVQGSEVQVVASFSPVTVQEQRGADGTLRSSRWEPWPDHPVTEMRLCFTIDQPCTPEGAWTPFLSEYRFYQRVDWVGDATFYLAAEFRTADGTTIATAGMGEFEPLEQADEVTLKVVARVDPNAPAGQTPNPQVQTAQAATLAAFPVSGSVLIEEGICCAGGTAGSQVSLDVTFEAQSPAGAVREMRVLTGSGCQRDAPALDAPWEPYAASRTFTTSLAINWVGFYVNVQYRDAQGNLSPVYCDDISLEGSPPRTP